MTRRSGVVWGYVLDSFPENWVTADQGRSDTNYTEARKRLPDAEPDCGCGQCHKCNANKFNPLEPVLVPIAVTSRIVVLQAMFCGRLIRLCGRRKRGGRLIFVTTQGASAHTVVSSRQLRFVTSSKT